MINKTPPGYWVLPFALIGAGMWMAIGASVYAWMKW